VVHIPISTTIYIDGAGTKETRTIMRAELVAIHTALSTFSTHDWIGIFTNSLSSLQAIRHHHTNPGTTSANHYHYHYETLPPPQTRRVETGEMAPRSQYWVMYTAKPPPPTPALSTGTNCATLHRPWWTIPEAERLQMHAFTRPSLQLRLKVRDALLRSLHHSSLYRRLKLANKEKGARTKTIEQALHKKLTHSPWEGIALLKFIYGQLYNSKLAMRYGHAPTDECPLCHMPDSCTHIARECPENEALRA